jgi:hypothetical protein
VHLHLPEHRPLAIAGACLVAGLTVLVVALAQWSHHRSAPVAPSAPLIAVAAPTPAPAAGCLPGDPIAEMRATWRRHLIANDHAHVPARWVAGFYSLYSRAQKAFAVNWLLLASVHREETAFSTAGSTYHGLNFAHCCAGPMQFNVTNGAGRSASTWERFRGAFRHAPRPATYPHPTATHPSVYDDFDAMMAAARLLSREGAGLTLDAAAWSAAYDYYGHDATGIAYADDVLARAIGWSQHGFSINQPVDPALRAAVDAAWGAPARAALSAKP